MVKVSNPWAVAADQVRFYQDRAAAEDWKQDHDDAMRCLRFEEQIALGITIFHLLCRLEDAWRARVSGKQLPFDRAVEDRFQALYAQWLRASPALVRQLKDLERHGFPVSGAEDFRTCCRDAEALLGLPDAPAPALPSYAALKALAERFPPPPEWFDGDEEKPF